jgi:hypothetical protein
MAVARYEDIRAEFLHRVQLAVYCIAATADAKGHAYFGLLYLTPWRVELAALGEASVVWRTE